MEPDESGGYSWSYIITSTEGPADIEFSEYSSQSYSVTVGDEGCTHTLTSSSDGTKEWKTGMAEVADLESVIADAVAQTPDGERPADTAKRIVAALAPDDEWYITKEYQTGLSGRPNIEVATPCGDYSSSVREDGCFHLFNYSNMSFSGRQDNNPDDISYMHICYLDEHIRRLVALREIQRRWFSGEDVPCCQHRCHWSADGQDQGCQACGETEKTPEGTP